ncbi:MAG: hypothetical protein MSD68_08615 [Blautia sp.]|uniref:hypothetical protein n=1 Tax=Blautia sp. TaxID=1955243 RepID=UPI0025C31560|nr:hypothetical protein [Blautia sp.]MCI7449736.1 hypothetical protein [Blautia sp.]
MKINSTTAKHIKKYCHIIGLLSFLIAFFVCSQMIRYQEKEKRAAGTYILMSIQNMKVVLEYTMERVVNLNYSRNSI